MDGMQFSSSTMRQLIQERYTRHGTRLVAHLPHGVEKVRGSSARSSGFTFGWNTGILGMDGEGHVTYAIMQANAFNQATSLVSRWQFAHTLMREMHWSIQISSAGGNCQN